MSMGFIRYKYKKRETNPRTKKKIYFISFWNDAPFPTNDISQYVYGNAYGHRM